jgi:hypothetical protein
MMDDDLFNDLCASIEEAGAHLRGEIDLPPEQIHVVGEPDPRAIRTAPAPELPRADAS